MGLLGKLFDQQPVKRAADDVLLMHSMLLMISADGVIDESELATLDGFIATLPELEGKDIQELIRQARRLVSRYPRVPDSVQALADIQSPVIRRKAFVLAVDIAMSSGDIDHNEDELLEQYQRVLGVDDATARMIVEVMAMKYAK
jgi:tellurite resistance protein